MEWTSSEEAKRRRGSACAASRCHSSGWRAGKSRTRQEKMNRRAADADAGMEGAKAPGPAPAPASPSAKTSSASPTFATINFRGIGRAVSKRDGSYRMPSLFFLLWLTHTWKELEHVPRSRRPREAGGCPKHRHDVRWEQAFSNSASQPTLCTRLEVHCLPSATTKLLPKGRLNRRELANHIARRSRPAHCFEHEHEHEHDMSSYEVSAIHSYDTRMGAHREE